MAIFTIFWYLFLAAIVYSFQKHTKCFSSWNTFTLFVAFVVLHHGISIPFCFHCRTAGFIVPYHVSVTFILNLILMYLFVLFGIKLVNVSHNFNPGKINVRMKLAGIGYNPLLFWPVLVISVILLLYVLSVATINIDPLDFVFQTLSKQEYKQARILFGESTSYHKGPVFYFVGIASFAFFPLLIFVLYFAKNYKSYIIYTCSFYALLLLLLYRYLVSGQKSTSLMILIGIFICCRLRKKGLDFNILNKKVLLVVLILFLAAAPYLYTVQYPEFDYLDALYATWFRLTIEPNRALQLYYYTYPNLHSHLFGASSHLMAKFFDSNVLPPHTYIPSKIFNGTHTTWNCIFVGDAWADFGFLGTVLSSFIVGFILQWYNIWFARSKKTALAVGTYVTLILAGSKLAACGLFTCFLTFGVASSFLFFLVLKQINWLKPRQAFSLKCLSR